MLETLAADRHAGAGRVKSCVMVKTVKFIRDPVKSMHDRRESRMNLEAKKSRMNLEVKSSTGCF